MLTAPCDMFFGCSVKRKKEFEEFQEFTGVALQKVVKFCSTRWLSLHRAVSRYIEQWPALKAYFNSHADVEKAGKVKNAAKQLNSNEMKFYYLFLEYILVPLNRFNVMFQVLFLGNRLLKLYCPHPAPET